MMTHHSAVMDTLRREKELCADRTRVVTAMGDLHLAARLDAEQRERDLHKEGA